jgi:beta-N-acetylhexosaminidase
MRLAVAAMAAALFPLSGGCGGSSVPRATEKHPVVRTPTPAASSRPAPRPAAPPPVPAAARAAAAQLPLEQRVAQLFLVGFDGTGSQADVLGELRANGWGGIVIGPDNAVDPAGVTALAGQAAVIARDGARPVPFVAADPELPGLPPGVAERRALGLTLSIGPHADVPIAGGPSPREAAALARRAVREGLAAGIPPAIGHFPGQGAASQDPLDGPAQVGLSRADLRRRDLVPFRAIAGRAPVVIVSSASFIAFDPVTPAAHLPAVVRGLLRGELRFAGVAMTDALGSLVAATGSSAGDAAVAAVRAGVDLVYVPDPRQRDDAYRAVLAAVKAGRVAPARVRDACARVLALKGSLGLLAPAGATATATATPGATATATPGAVATPTTSGR